MHRAVALTLSPAAALVAVVSVPVALRLATRVPRPRRICWRCTPTISVRCSRGFPLALEAGTYGVSWILPLVLLIAARPRVRPLLPALALGAGTLLAFLVFDYLHDREDPKIRIQ